MEIIFEAIASFLMNRLGQAIIHWSASLRSKLGSVKDDCDQEPTTASSPTRVVLPRADYIEAMVGDLLECQQKLKRRGLSDRTILLLTVWSLIGFTSDVLQIMLQNVRDPGPLSPKLPTSDVPQPPEDDDDPPDIEGDVY